MRPTTKMFNDAILSADNWRRNYDEMKKAANTALLALQRQIRYAPLFFITGIMLGVLGTLLATLVFNVN